MLYSSCTNWTVIVNFKFRIFYLFAFTSLLIALFICTLHIFIWSYRTLYFPICSTYFKIASCDIYVTSSKWNNDWKQAMCTKDIFSNQFTGKYALPPHIQEIFNVLSLATGKLGILQWRTETQKQKSNFDAKLVSKHVHKSVLQDQRK